MQHATRSIRASLNKATATALAGVMAVSLCPLPTTPAAYADTAAEKQAEAEQALANLNTMQETLDRLSAEYGEALAAQEEAEKSRDAAEERIDEINGEIGDLQGRLNDRARDMYRSGSVPFLDMLLGARTFEEFATSWDMLNKVNENDVSMVETQRELKSEAEDQAKVFNEQALLASQKSQEAADAAKQAESTVAEMQATYDSLSAEAAQLLEEERKAQEAAEAARAAAIVAESAAAAAAQQQQQQQAQAQEQQQRVQDQARDQGQGQARSNDADDDDLAAAAANVTGGTADDSADAAASAASEAAEDASNAAADANAEEASEEKQEEAAEQPAYEGGSDTVSRAYACLGAAYVWGGVGPDGYDCSGLVSYCLSGSHTRLGTTLTFMNWPQVSNPQPGDICVNSGHTGIYIGDGQMIHAATYGVGVIIGPVQSGMIIVRYPG